MLDAISIRQTMNVFRIIVFISLSFRVLYVMIIMAF